ncbi:sulfur carrier protein ThiS [Fibrobacter sp. UWP2]|jgi:sulfur carrier protein|uniref:sulfur carrier protein ThiS n=1 Tax=Fibrobacter sp. UWP2 TaxID=1896216 RepID=UPI00092326D8|nr:sulfur carrier protein ThiS [Fibrobacter sp. UWP2]SHI99092.1 sulfur carrier protein [Fibrobacter sp. UWP2]
MVKVNGVDVDTAGQTLADYLATTDFDVKRIAVELNEEIVPKAKYAETTLADGDVVEVVSFVGGG